MQTATPTQPKSIWNEVAFTGNLGKDPEMSFTGKGTAVTKFSIAVSQGKDKPPMWLNLECWKELAEQCNIRLAKGARVEVKGRLIQDTWTDKESNKRTAFKVVVQTVRLLKRADGASASGFIEEDGAESETLGEVEEHPF